MVNKFYLKTLLLLTISLFSLMNINALKKTRVLSHLKIPTHNFKAYIPKQINSNRLTFLLNEQDVKQVLIENNFITLNFSYIFNNTPDTENAHDITIIINLIIITKPDCNYLINAIAKLYVNQEHNRSIHQTHAFKNITNLEPLICRLVNDLISPT